jgi:hypothetical protein
VVNRSRGERDGDIDPTGCRAPEYQEGCEGCQTEADSGAPAQADENRTWKRGREGCGEEAPLINRPSAAMIAVGDAVRSAQFPKL